MKKFIILLTFIFLFITTSCGKKYEDVAIENVLGTYEFSSCTYANSHNPTEALKYNLNNRNAVYYILAGMFSIDNGGATEIELDNVSYKLSDATSLLEVTDEYSEFVSGDLTRYDIYRKGYFQSYAIYIKDYKYYFVEFRKIHTTDELYQIWYINEITKKI